MENNFCDTLENYSPLIRKIANSWNKTIESTTMDVKDLEQEIEIELFKKYGEFDREKGGWGTFIRVIGTNKIKKIIETENRQKRKPEHSIELNKTNEEENELNEIIKSDTETPLQMVLYKELYEQLFNAASTVRYKPMGYSKTNPFTQQLFLEIVSPSNELTDLIRKRIKEIDKQKKKNKRIKSRLKNIATEDVLAIHFNVKISNIRRGLRLMKQAIIKAANVYGYRIREPY